VTEFICLLSVMSKNSKTDSKMSSYSPVLKEPRVLRLMRIIIDYSNRLTECKRVVDGAISAD